MSVRFGFSVAQSYDVYLDDVAFVKNQDAHFTTGVKTLHGKLIAKAS